MKSRPILFSGPMVRALLDGTKTQTRRVVKPDYCQATEFKTIDELGNAWFLSGFDGYPFKCPYGQPGDRLWVRETFRLFDSSVECACYEECRCSKWHGKPVYRATNEGADGSWKPSIFMPRAASRITLEITSIRVERLNGISDKDAIAEGIRTSDGAWMSYSKDYNRCVSPVTSYRTLWESINGPGSWAMNPFVWVIEFRKVEQ